MRNKSKKCKNINGENKMKFSKKRKSSRKYEFDCIEDGVWQHCATGIKSFVAIWGKYNQKSRLIRNRKNRRLSHCNEDDNWDRVVYKKYIRSRCLWAKFLDKLLQIKCMYDAY